MSPGFKRLILPNQGLTRKKRKVPSFGRKTGGGKRNSWGNQETAETDEKPTNLLWGNNKEESNWLGKVNLRKSRKKDTKIG